MFATRHGWIVGDEYAFVDDGVFAGEFAARPGFVRLMAALKPRTPFQVAAMIESSRLVRKRGGTGYAR